MSKYFHLSTNQVIDKYGPSHIEYTGRKPNCSKDGVLYFDEKIQNVEIVGVKDEEEMKSVRKVKPYSSLIQAPIPSIMRQFDCSEDKAREILKTQMKGQPLVEDFLYTKIIDVLNKKNKNKYQDFWLLISYSSLFRTGCLSEKKRRNFILKVLSEKKVLICSIRKIFKKVLFVPLNKVQKSHQIFEWNI